MPCIFVLFNMLFFELEEKTMEKTNRNVIAVGAGDYYFKLVIPTLKFLQSKGAVG